MRIQFLMTQEQMDKLIAASQPVMMIALQCGDPPSPQENANNAWNALGKEMGFDGSTAKPIAGASQLSFTAEEVIE